ncbi:MAG: type 4a pilus biogenesis protein PilO [Gammaproteobacteria bacterium]|jgi:type IV pilus assembly protein PilO
MNLSDLNDLDLSTIGDWPPVVKGTLILVVCALIIGGWYFHAIKGQYVMLEGYQKEEAQLRAELVEKYRKVVNLDEYREQLAQMEADFSEMLRQLPDRSEIAALLVEVSQTGLAAGLEFELFQPMAEVPGDFYTELPINMKVVGSYHQFGGFISGLAAMPRILTIHDVNIVKRNKDSVEQSQLQMAMVAKTYRYLGEGDQEESE